MSDGSQNNLWIGKKTPALEYCSLARASALLDCEVADLLHWAEIGAVELCLKFEGYRAALSDNHQTGLTPDDFIKDLAPFPRELNYLTPLSGFLAISELVVDEKTGKRVRKYSFQYEDDEAFKAPKIFLYGLWALSPYFAVGVSSTLAASRRCVVSDLDFEVHPADFSVYLTEEVDKSLCPIIALPVTEHLYKDRFRIKGTGSLFEISIDDLFITRIQMEKIHSMKGEVMASFVSGDIERAHSEIDGDLNAKPIRTTAKQANYIVGLLKGIGFTDDELAGSISELRAKITSRCKGALPDVDDKTLADWLRRGGVSR